MKYAPIDYEMIDKAALQLRMDYGFLNDRIDIFELARKIGMTLIPYSKLMPEQSSFIDNIKTLDDGFTVMRYENKALKFYTFYNDSVGKYRQRFTIAHEIKHVIFEEFDPDEKQEDLANHFARYILAPTCIVMKYKDESPYELAYSFNISFEAADHALVAANNRIAFRRNKMEDYEKAFLEETKEK